ncbi:MAG TPA: PaaI family thioesterase [Actinomycetota bacterium]|nr:PaaI family thioesterase [Actinomycetota bacterium]
MNKFKPGDHFHDLEKWEERRPEGPHIWRTLGYNRTLWEPGRQVIEWKATEDYSFPIMSGHIVHGGMVSTILDTAMGGACWTLLNNDEAFLTSNLNVEFFRATRPGLLRAEGRVVSRTKRAIFCAADLFDEDGKHTAGARCTQIVLPSETAGRPWHGKDEKPE